MKSINSSHASSFAQAVAPCTRSKPSKATSSKPTPNQIPIKFPCITLSQENVLRFAEMNIDDATLRQSKWPETASTTGQRILDLTVQGVYPYAIMRRTSWLCSVTQAKQEPQKSINILGWRELTCPWDSSKNLSQFYFMTYCSDWNLRVNCESKSYNVTIKASCRIARIDWMGGMALDWLRKTFLFLYDSPLRRRWGHWGLDQCSQFQRWWRVWSVDLAMVSSLPIR